MKDKKIIPLVLYSKTHKENISKEDIKIALAKVFNEL